MKKIKNLFVLSLIVLSFFSAINVSAQAEGYCTYPKGTKVSGYTQAQCAADNGTWSPGSPAQPVTSGGGSNISTTCTAISGVGSIICTIDKLLKAAIPIIITLGVVYFVWGVVQYVIGGDEEAKKKGRSRIINGIIGFVVIFGFWGLVTIVINTFGLDQAVVQRTDLTPTFVDTSQNFDAGATCKLVTNPKLQNLLGYATCIIVRSVIPLVFALAVASFIWGVVQYVINSSEETKKEKGRQFMVWGIIALTVMVSVWGLVAVVGRTFGITGVSIPQLQSK